MKLKPIFETAHNPEYKFIKDELKERYGSLDVRLVAESYNIQNLYHRNVYTGTLKEGVEISELQLSMMCDGGYSHFGGSSVINGRRFRVEISTD